MKQDRIGDALLPPSAAPGTRIGQALLWQPSYVRDDKILWHVPFLFWLLEAIRPRRYVEIGVGEGVAYMAVCQALHRVRANSQCYAVGEWHSSDGGTQVPERLAARNADLYEDFSEILSDGPEKAAEAIEDGSIDLMLVDLTQAPQVAPSVPKVWMPKLTKSGILLVNGIDEGDSAAAVLVNALSEQSPTVRMPGGDGLLVVLPAADQEDDLANITALAPDDPAHKLIIQMFTRLGAGTYYETHARDDERRSQELDERIRSLSDERDALSRQLGDLTAQYESRHRKVATMQSRAFDLQLALADAHSQSERVAEELAGARVERDEARQDVQRLSDELDALRATHEQRVAELTKLHSDEAKRHQRAREELEARREKQDETATLLTSEQKARADAEKARDEVQRRLDEEASARWEAERARDDAQRRLDEESAARAEAERARDDAQRRLDEESAARAEAERARDDAQRRLDEESAARAEAERARDDAQRRLDAEATARADAASAVEEEKQARLDAEEAQATAVAEAEQLRSRVTALVMDSDKSYRVIRSLLESVEQSENLVTALGEEVRALRQQIDARAAPVETSGAADATEQVPAGWLQRVARRKQR